MKRLAAAAALLLAPAFAAAYVITSDRWPTAALRMHAGALPSTFATAFSQAAQKWTNATGFALTTDLAGIGACDVFNGPLLEGAEFANRSCDGSGFGSGTIAVTEWFNDGAGTRTSVGITFNANETWGVYDGPLQAVTLDFRRVALHELGHAIGLDHETSTPSIMNPTIGDDYWLTPDDVAGVFARYPELSRVVLLGPTGTISASDPIFQWRSFALATGYGFKLLQPDGSVVREWYSPSQVACGAGQSVCSLQRAQALQPGHYAFSVYVEISGAAGKWTRGDFDVSGPTQTPDAVTPLAPTGLVERPDPTFQWSAVALATDYRLELTPPGAAPLYFWFGASAAGCAGGAGTCAVPSPAALADGVHRFRVQSSNGSIRGRWSAQVSFAVALEPAKPVLLAPSGTVSDPRPVFAWSDAARASSYRLNVKDARGNVTRVDLSPAALGCDTGTAACTTQLSTDLPNGASHAWVRASNAFGTGPWSDELRFTVSAPLILPGATAIVAPIGSIATHRPDVVFTPAANATSYRVRRVGPSGAVVATNVTARSVGCDGPGATTCVLPTTTDLASGTHRLSVRGINASGNGPWSAEVSVTITP
ncbi:MAG TPA: matrixin family metalloprotease [Myxococcota bacterium]|jgi:hypothetical protein|nr:matrixin family metalloprotease [Myxococcota bacterium]